MADDLEAFLSWNAHVERLESLLLAKAIYSHGDFFPHNLLWKNNTPCLIDWELAGLINLDMEAVLASILFGGCVMQKSFEPHLMKVFFDAYIATGVCIQVPFHDALWGALGKAWLNWMAFQASISVNQALPVEEQKAASENIMALFQS